ncbi:hypothetical protein [Bacillus cereus]|uniref:hypothetical protein n=1 Tax=Bacillus cereus TaxID=1396 RepID=UPI00217ED55B|nr:hypothetical protein [Bacillus cereus]MCS6595309.1 hypothetical protein [Bacillus cereus]
MLLISKVVFVIKTHIKGEGGFKCVFRFFRKIKRVAIIYDLTLCLRSDELLRCDSSAYFHANNFLLVPLVFSLLTAIQKPPDIKSIISYITILRGEKKMERIINKIMSNLQILMRHG